MVLFKTFDSMPYDLLTPKLLEYELSTDTITFIYSCPKRRKINVKMNDLKLLFRLLSLGLPYRFIFGTLIFNTFINQLLLGTNLADFTYDNKIYRASKDKCKVIAKQL